MKNDPNENARLASDSYRDRSKELLSGEDVAISGVKYTILAVADDPKTGFQGTAYRRTDGTGQVIIAHRGTEPSMKDAATDLGMVFHGRNNQLDEAMKFTELAMALARQEAQKKGEPLSLSITGHSLGGTLAQITAAKYGVPAQTFNAYGPGGLTNLGRYGVDVHASFPNIVNHVRATDVVGAGGHHLGQVKTYAAAQDIEGLQRGRYIGSSLLPANPLLAAELSAHSIANFLPANKILGESVMSEANEARARAYAGPIAQYRSDVIQGRIDLDKIAEVPAILPLPIATVARARLAMQASDAISSSALEKVQQTMVGAAQFTATQVQTAAGAVGGAANDGLSWIQGVVQPPAPPGRGALVDQPLYQDALGQLKAYNTAHDIPSDRRIEQAAGAIAAAAAAKGLSRIDHLEPSEDGSKLIAVQGAPGHVHSKLVDVSTQQALNTSLADSSRAFEQTQRESLAPAQGHSQGRGQVQPPAMAH
ncbi:DUF2974 domain-containing protein [Xenophilus arseniciresistens]|uniref:DUF2974 domain-containing protein n=1 Tax=Xenophilus arseniciresistens TaxID=1283306 RepID=A0AAE3NDT7_9BURK|nr:XVIPCD domain-containing protein [Xenophilus arseniciresistens]MDA7418422.1 DUF2974 domain-containing protein [Xenophilus arseniciresistens]